MFKSRPVQYLGLAVLVLACLGIIYYPVGTTPQPDTYTLYFKAPGDLEKLAKATQAKGDKETKSASDIAGALLDAEFKASNGEKTTSGLFTVAAGGKEASIQDEASNRSEAVARTERIVKALNFRFPGIELTPESADSLMSLPPKPLVALGQYAVFPLQKRGDKVQPAVRLGLDLQGGVNLVLQVRRALFTYNFSPELGKGTESRDAFTSKVRAALATAPGGIGLDEADINLTPGKDNVLEIRTQAKDKAEFERQKDAILKALQAQVSDVKFTANTPQFFEPDKSVGEQLGLSKNYSREILDRTVEIVRSRVDKLGVAEPQIQAQGTDRIIVQLPGVKDPEKAVAVIGTTAQMEIRLLPEDITPMQDPSDPGTTLFRDSKTNNPIPSNQVRERSELIVSGKDVKPTTTAGFAQGQEPAVFFELQGDGARKFSQVTGAVAGKNRYIPIFLDERCISAPTVNDRISGSGQISGGFKDVEEARSLALLLNSGALPAPIDVVENRTVSATLGQDALDKSVRAGLIGLLLVAVYMVIFYRLPGMLANCALAIYCVLNLAVFNLVGGTLTLPGIAGFLLAIAMSLDTNILVFERLHEEMEIQPTFASALRAAFSRAWTAILDSHVTTLLAAVVLFMLGTGPVKGFALTLGIGVLLSLFSAISVTRLFMWSVAGVGETSPKLFGGKERPEAAIPATTGRVR